MRGFYDMEKDNEYFNKLSKALVDLKDKKKGLDPLIPVSYSDFLVKEFTDVPYIVKNLIVKGGINMISGSAGVGKTFVSLEFILSIASGCQAFKNFETEKSNVLLINEEDTERSLHKRLLMMTEEKSLPIHFLLHKGIKIDNEKQTDQVIELIKQNSIGIVVLDNLTQLHDLDENKADEIKKIFFQMRRLIAVGATILIIHHHRKKGTVVSTTTIDLGDSLRGSSVIYGSLDTHLAVERIEDANGVTIAMSQTKNKEDELLKPFKVSMKTNGEKLSFDYVGFFEKSATKLMQAQDIIMNILSSGPFVRKSRKDLFEAIPNAGRDNISKAIKNLETRGIIMSKTRGALRDNGGNSVEKLFWIPSDDDRRQDPLFLVSAIDEDI